MATAQEPASMDALEQMVDEAIAACDGDARAAVRALLVINEFLEHELDTLVAQVSHGYTRGRFAARRRRSKAH